MGRECRDKLPSPPHLFLQGKVPRNEYGNVEMFKPSMLPVGGAHIKSECGTVWPRAIRSSSRIDCALIYPFSFYSARYSNEFLVVLEHISRTA